MVVTRSNPFWIVVSIVVLAVGVLFLLPFVQENVSGKAAGVSSTPYQLLLCNSLGLEVGQSEEVNYYVEVSDGTLTLIGTSVCTLNSGECSCTTNDASSGVSLEVRNPFAVNYVVNGDTRGSTTCSLILSDCSCDDNNLIPCSLLVSSGTGGDTGTVDGSSLPSRSVPTVDSTVLSRPTRPIPTGTDGTLTPTLPTDTQLIPTSTSLPPRPTSTGAEGPYTRVCQVNTLAVDCICLSPLTVNFAGYCVQSIYTFPIDPNNPPTQLRRMFSTIASGMDDFVSQWKFDQRINSYDELLLFDPLTNTFYPDLASAAGIDSFTPNTIKGKPHGAIHGPSLSDDGVVGTSMSFDGSSDYIEVKDFSDEANTELDLDGDFTISFWVKVDEEFSDYSTTGTIIYKDLGGVIYQILVVPKVSNSFQVNFKLLGSSAERILSSTSDVPLQRGEWNHIVTRLNGDKMSLFLNGIFNDEKPLIGRDLSSITSVYIGAQPRVSGGTLNHFKGLLDELTLYGRALTEEEIKSLYERDKPCEFNFLCPSREEVASLEDIDRSYLKRIADYIDRVYPSVDELSDVKSDLSENFGLFGFNPAGVNNRKGEAITYFVHKNKAYVLELSEPYDPFEGEVYLGVRNIGSTEYIEELEMTLDEEYSNLYLPPMTYQVDLDGEGEDIYVHLQGYFSYNEEGKLGLLAIIDPVINFDFLSIGNQVMLNLEPREFIYDLHPYEMAFVQEGTQDIMVIDEEQYYENFGEYGKHNFDELGHFYIEFTHPEPAKDISTGDFHHGIYRMTEFNRFPTNLENTYQDYFTVTKTMPLGTSVRSGTVFAVYGSKRKGSDLLKYIVDIKDKGGFASSDEITTTSKISSGRAILSDSGLSRPSSGRASPGIVPATGLATDSYYSGLDAGDTLKVCSLNFPDPYVVDVCRTVGDTPIFGLEADVPSLVGGFDTELFYYKLPEDDQEKRVDAYYLHDLSEPIEEPRRFAYNLVKKRGFAFFVLDEETAEFYILSHPEQANLDFSQMSLETLTDKDLPPPLAEAEDYRVVFNLPVERFAESNDNMFRQIKVERITDRETLDSEDIKYVISTETKIDNIVDLEREFETWVDTYGYVTLTDIGTIRLNPTDVTTAKNHMDIAIDNDPIQLFFETPKVVDNMLFIYNTAETLNNYYHSKKADIHLFYDLNTDSISHPFTDKDFTLPMMKGKEIALGINDRYYLFGYNPSKTVGDPDPVTNFFEEKELQLKRVNGIEAITKEVKTGEVIFTLASREKVRVKFELEDLEDKEVLITLEPPTEIKQITLFDPASEFYAELPEWTAKHDKILQIDRDEYYNCDTEDTKTFQTYTLLCKKGSSAPIKLNQNQPVLERDFLVTYRGLLGTKKLVTFQKIVGDLSYAGSSMEGLDWAALRDNWTKNKMPAVAIDNQYYDLAGGNTFADVRLVEIASGELFSNQPYVTAEGASRGMIPINGTLFSVEQSLVDYRIALNVKKEGFMLVTPEGFVIDRTAEFISQIGKEVYTITLEELRDRVKVTIEKEGKPFFIRTMPTSSQRILLPNKDRVHLEVIQEGTMKVRLSEI